MSTQSSKRPDSAIPVRHMDMAQLTQQVLRLQQENAALKKASSADPGHHATNELALAYAQIQTLREENSELSNLRSLHDEYGCPELMQITQREVVHAQLRQRSAEAESKGFRHLHLANKSMEKQILTAQKLLGDSTRELRLSEAEVTSLKLSIEVYRQGQMDAEDKVALLEAELLRCKQREANQSSITIHIDSSQPKKWNLIKRARAAMAQNTTLDIQGPPELVASFVSGMRTVEIDHKKQTAAAEHWQKVANDARVNTVTSPICTVPGHRSMKDELEAKDQQLKMQNQLVATWQKRHGEIKGFMDRAGIEMRAQGVRGVL
ncbi:hypothetical protein HBI82_180860 [Parastagonospora nodorum]|nr:hypothetical protein HBH61_131610 [Parastagonospora nodorum]KAH4961937.1 hypothetical protein HBI78_136900 [Parastagonospora nodorum]KAH5994462.1 hypothetical protein HBI82_180860 [Parastagonospora nodorum]